MYKLPLVITKLELWDNIYYRVTYNNIWIFINSYEQIKDSSNIDEINPTLILIERQKKVLKLLNKENIIYKGKVIFEKNNY